MDRFDVEDKLHRLVCESLENGWEEGESGNIPAPEGLAAVVHRRLDDLKLILPEAEGQRIVRAVVDRITGLGPLEPLLQNPQFTEIMVNDHEHVFVEQEGKIVPTGVRFRDEAHLRHVIDRIVAPLGRRIDESSPLVDARLGDGSRVHAVIPPLAIKGPVLTIRKFLREPFTLERLIHLKTIDENIASALQKLVMDRRSIIVSGGTGSGKTSTLNALGRCIPRGERLITIEDSAELNLGHPHLVSLEARPPNLEGKGEITIRTLVRNSLRMRPDRIIVGEVRGGEAFDMLQAMNTGHRGSLTTLHANSARDALIRLESMVLMAGFEMPLAAIRRMILGAVELILQQDRLPDGSRVMTGLYRLAKDDGGDYEISAIFRYEPGGGESRWLEG